MTSAPTINPHKEAARALYRLHKELRPLAERVRLVQVTFALAELLYGDLHTEEERMELGALVAQVGIEEERG